MIVDTAPEALVPFDSYHSAINIYFSTIAPILPFNNFHESNQFHRGRYNYNLCSFGWESPFSSIDLNTAVNTLTL